MSRTRQRALVVADGNEADGSASVDVVTLLAGKG